MNDAKPDNARMVHSPTGKEIAHYQTLLHTQATIGLEMEKQVVWLSGFGLGFLVALAGSPLEFSFPWAMLAWVPAVVLFFLAIVAALSVLRADRKYIMAILHRDHGNDASNERVSEIQRLDDYSNRRSNWASRLLLAGLFFTAILPLATEAGIGTLIMILQFVRGGHS